LGESLYVIAAGCLLSPAISYESCLLLNSRCRSLTFYYNPMGKNCSKFLQSRRISFSQLFSHRKFTWIFAALPEELDDSFLEHVIFRNSKKYHNKINTLQGMLLSMFNLG